MVIPERVGASLAHLHRRRFRLRVGLAHAYLPETRQRVALELADVDLRLASRYRGVVRDLARQAAVMPPERRAEQRRAMLEVAEAMAFHVLEARGIFDEWMPELAE